MSEAVWYVDSSAIVKLVVSEPESPALTQFFGSSESLVSSALATTELTRAVLGLGGAFLGQVDHVLDRFELVRINDDILRSAGLIQPASVRSLDAIHLATAALFEDTLAGLVTYDLRMQGVARSLGWNIQAPK